MKTRVGVPMAAFLLLVLLGASVDSGAQSLGSGVLTFLVDLGKGVFSNDAILTEAAKKVGFIKPEALLMRQEVFRSDTDKHAPKNVKAISRPLTLFRFRELTLQSECAQLPSATQSAGEGLPTTSQGVIWHKSLKGYDRFVLGPENDNHTIYENKLYLVSVQEVKECSAVFTIMRADRYECR